MPLKKVISGGQIGADIAGLRAAHIIGLETGGFMPKGFKILYGYLDQDDVERFGLVETSSPNYPMRTRLNVAAADGTIRLAHNFYSPGERLTLRLIKELERPFFDVSLGRRREGSVWSWSVEGKSHEFNLQTVNLVVQWIRDQEIETLNVAGNANQSIEPFVAWFLAMVFTLAS